MTSANAIIQALEAINADSFADTNERHRVEDALVAALNRVRTPWDIGWNHVWVNAPTNASIKILIDAGIFKKWVENGSKPQTTDELAEFTSTDPALIRRLLRQLASQHLILETAEDTYAPSPWAIRLGTDPAFPSVYGTFYHDTILPLLGSLPSFIKETGFKNPRDSDNCTFQYVRGPGTSYFDWVSRDPLHNAEFADAMECHSRGNLTAWVDLYPTSTLLRGAKPDRPLVVDIGGSKGHDLEKFRLKHADALPDGSLVLEDLPGILQDVRIGDDRRAIAVTPYDFLTPQPVRGARAYFLHIVLHDWPDDVCVRILRNVAAAMEPGYSKLLIHETLVADVRPSPRVTATDISMMAIFASAERSEREWRRLIETDGLGLRVVKIWNPHQTMESIIEVELAGEEAEAREHGPPRGADQDLRTNHPRL
ncbi:hypothetical protein SLS62_011099 [Diatrype stigma]|uniref:O-methyltransferase C-terminal domain-containing protein n=1 Tax=Diatrype stigma TaxID=117547 RepID=A0AAN9U6F1_9PEZI